MERYLGNEDWTTPLSLAVFGPPGSGKSFTIRQILGSINADIAKRPLEYNISQFAQVKDLEVAFHKVQDEAVAGVVPLVFFDEFDSDNLTWLKNFLAPMQDGKFKAGESTYRIGRAIFVFAGGVSKSWYEFYEGRKSEDGFKNAKGPDFVSRLRGYLDIVSINSSPKTGSHQDDSGMDGVTGTLMFRRAVLLRGLLEKHLPYIFDKNTKEAQIDAAVVNAFLQIRKYEHEARSMQAIIEMSRPSPRGAFLRSYLPNIDQMNMHVDTEEFYELLGASTLPIEVSS